MLPWCWMMARPAGRALLGAMLLALLVTLAACVETPVAPSAAAPVAAPPLRVGMAGHYPPLSFRQADGWAGIDFDLAKRLAQHLGRPLRIVETRRNQLIPTLMDGRIDIIMSGMTITDARKIRIDFSDHYLRAGLYALMRSEDSQRYRGVRDVLDADANVGVVVDTTGDVFLQKNMPNAVRWGLSKAAAAPFELANHKIDLFIYDAPAVMWLVSENEAELVALQDFLDTEYLGWGLRRGDAALLGQVNAVLAEWKRDGTLERVLRHWLPYQKKLL